MSHRVRKHLHVEDGTATITIYAVHGTYEILMDESDLALVDWKRLCITSSRGFRPYVKYAPAEGKHAQLHRFLMQPPVGFEVDHVNGNGLDNRRRNLDVVTHSENMKRSWFWRKLARTERAMLEARAAVDALL